MDLLAYDNSVDDARGILLVPPVRIGDGEQRWYWNVLRNKVFLQISLERNSSNFSYISFLDVNFKNPTVEFYVPCVRNMQLKIFTFD